eukprot:scaffold421186_cov56-Attheya_sp.AAC.1
MSIKSVTASSAPTATLDADGASSLKARSPYDEDASVADMALASSSKDGALYMVNVYIISRQSA